MCSFHHKVVLFPHDYDEVSSSSNWGVLLSYARQLHPVSLPAIPSYPILVFCTQSAGLSFLGCMFTKAHGLIARLCFFAFSPHPRLDLPRPETTVADL